MAMARLRLEPFLFARVGFDTCQSYEARRAIAAAGRPTGLWGLFPRWQRGPSEGGLPGNTMIVDAEGLAEVLGFVCVIRITFATK